MTISPSCRTENWFKLAPPVDHNAPGQRAARAGFVQRNRKIDPVTFFWVLVLGFGVGVQRTIASLRRAYETVSAETLVPSSFYDRFNKGLIAFLKECLAHGIAHKNIIIL